MSDNFERLVISSLISDAMYFDACIPYLKDEYFEDTRHKEIFRCITKFNEKYHKAPSKDTLIVDLESSTTITTDTLNELVHGYVEGLVQPKDIEPLWLLQETESWVINQAVFIAFAKGYDILESKDIQGRGQLPDLMRDALAISFDNKVGIEWGATPEEQWDYYNSPESLIEFDLQAFNKLFKGGLRRKTLSVLMSSKTGGFKSGTMCHISAAAQMAGHNVLYITCELAEREIYKRVDANLMDINLDDLHKLPQQTYVNRANTLKSKATGKLIVKEYPTSSAHSGHFRHAIRELKNKQNFVPDLICVDYLNICASSRYSSGGHNSYTVVKGIAEEIRALAMEFDCAIISGTQSGRQGVKAGTNIDVDDVSESYGLSATVDVLLAIIDDEELSNQNLLLYKPVKNRFADIHKVPLVKVGVEKAKMKLFDVDDDFSFGSNDSDTPTTDTKDEIQPDWNTRKKLGKDKQDVSEWVV